MTRILFVDDEQSVLQGLRRMLRSRRDQWDMTFATGGEEALAALEEQHVDVLVTDMRMPGIDGPTLLAEVARRYPQTVRIVLSGHSSKNTTIRSVGLTHQYLSKPCDKDALERAILRALGLREALRSPLLTQLLTQIGALPSLPSLYAELMGELQRDDTTAKRVGDIVARDPAMTAKVLQLVNSAYFGLSRHISNPAQAVVLLGVDTIKALVLGVGLFAQFRENADVGLDLEALWGHSFCTAAAAKRIAVAEGMDAQATDEAFTGGLLHDVGKLILADGLTSRYRDVLARAHGEGVDGVESERAEFGVTHAEIGAHLLSLWGLPDPVVEAVAYHHAPEVCAQVPFGSVAAVCISNALAHQRQAEPECERLDLDWLSAMGITHRVDTWRKLVEPLFDGGTCESGKFGAAT